MLRMSGMRVLLLLKLMLGRWRLLVGLLLLMVLCLLLMLLLGLLV